MGDFVGSRRLLRTRREVPLAALCGFLYKNPERHFPSTTFNLLHLRPLVYANMK